MPAFPKPNPTETDPVASPAVSAEATARAEADAAHAALTTSAHGGVVSSSDSRLTNARTPTAHKSTHATGQSDALAPSDIGAATAAAAAAAQSTADGAVDLADTKVPLSTVTAKGDLIVGTASATVTNKAVGSDGQVLTADAASAAGVKWTTPSSGGVSLSAANSWTASQTFDGSSSTDAAIFGGRGAPSAQRFALTNRVGATPGDFTFPVATIRPTTTTKISAFDVMPNGSPTQDSSNGKAWVDVCNADVLASTTGAVGTARMGVFTDHVEFGTRLSGGASALDLWIAANNNGSSAPNLKLKSTGEWMTNTLTPHTNAAWTAYPGYNTWIPIVCAGAASQSADLFAAYLTVNGTRGFSIGNTGIPKWGNSNGQTTVGAAGAASALPATPSRYLKVVGDNGTSYVIPAYAAS